MAIGLGWLAWRGDAALDGVAVARTHAEDGFTVAVLGDDDGEVFAIAARHSEHVPVLAFFAFEGTWSAEVCVGGAVVCGIDRHEERGLFGDVDGAAAFHEDAPGLLRRYAATSGRAFPDDEHDVDDEWGHLDLARRLGIAFEKRAEEGWIRPGEVVISTVRPPYGDRPSVYEVVRVEGRKAELRCTLRAGAAGEITPDLEGRGWRRAISRADAGRLREALGAPLPDPLDRKRRVAAARKWAERAWPAKDSAEVLRRLAAARGAKEWLSPLEADHERLALDLLAGEIAAAEGLAAAQLAAWLAGRGHGKPR